VPVLFCVRPVGRAVRMYLDLWSDCRCHAGGGVSGRLSVHAVSTALPEKTDVATIWRGAVPGEEVHKYLRKNVAPCATTARFGGRWRELFCISTALPEKTDVATIWRGAGGGGGSQISAEKRGPLRDNSSFWWSTERALLYQYSRARVWRGAELVGERGRWWF